MGQFKVGVSKVNITPPIGIDLTGFGFRDRPSEGIHDELYAKALVLDNGKEKVAIVTCDLLALSKDSVHRIRRLVEKSTGIKNKNIMISCTHTHSGPATIFLSKCGEIDTQWLETTERKIADVISHASKNMKSAKFGVGKGKIDGLSINRRGTDANGKVPHINVSDPNGAVDKELGVLRFDNLRGYPIAMLTNFSCHPIVFPDEDTAYLISADFPGEAQRIMENERDIVSLYSNSTAGNINPTSGSKGLKAAGRYGLIFAQEALGVFDRIQTISDVKIKIASKMVELKYKHIPTLEEMKEILKENVKRHEHIKRSNIPISFTEFFDSAVSVEWAKKTFELIQSRRNTDCVKIEIQVFMINDVILVGIPGEVFVEIGLDIKEKSPSDNTFIIGYANGHIGYIPTSEAHQKGGYEVERAFKSLGYPSCFKPHADELIKRTVCKIIEELRRGLRI